MTFPTVRSPPADGADGRSYCGAVRLAHGADGGSDSGSIRPAREEDRDGSGPAAWWSIFWRITTANVRAGMQYRFNFVMFTLLAAFVVIAEFLGIATVVAAFGTIHGWNIYEIGYLYGVLMCAKYLYRWMAAEVKSFERLIIGGELDQLLLRPIPLLLAVMTARSRKSIGEMLQAVGVLSVCMAKLMADGRVGWWIVPQTAFMIATETAIVFAVGLATATCGFWIYRIDDLETLTDNATITACQYPLSIFPDWLRTFLLTVIPMGFVNYVPSLYVLRGEYGPWVLAATGAVAVAALLSTLSFWRLGVTKYQSSGS